MLADLRKCVLKGEVYTGLHSLIVCQKILVKKFHEQMDHPVYHLDGIRHLDEARFNDGFFALRHGPCSAPPCCLASVVLDVQIT